MIAGLVIHRWCLLEICSKLEIINIVTDAHMETAKNGLVSHHYYLNQSHNLPCIIAYRFILYVLCVHDFVVLTYFYSS